MWYSTNVIESYIILELSDKFIYLMETSYGGIVSEIKIYLIKCFFKCLWIELNSNVGKIKKRMCF